MPWLRPCHASWSRWRQVFLTALGRRPVGGHGVHFELFLVILGGVLRRRWDKRGVDALAAAGDEAFLEQLRGDAIEDGRKGG